MADREKVINGLEQIVNDPFMKARADYWVLVCSEAIVLLKEQEPIEPVDDGHGSLICGNQGYECGCVGRYDITTKVVEKYCNFCPECGRKVKWE
jgi:hypothetical protein